MKKFLYFLLAVFLVIDLYLAYSYFGDRFSLSAVLQQGPGTCKILEQKYCDKVALRQDGSGGKTAEFSIPAGIKIYAPVDGKLSHYITPNLPGALKGTIGNTVHYLTGSDGFVYYLLFEPKVSPKDGEKSIKEGEIIGISTGKEYTYLKNTTLSVTIKKDGQFSKDGFDALFK